MQANLKWNNQAYSILDKLRKRLVGLAKLKYICSFPLRKTIIEGIFNSILVYCLGGLDSGDLKDLQVLHKKDGQIVTWSPPRASKAPMYDRLGWLTVNQLILPSSAKPSKALASASAEFSLNVKLLLTPTHPHTPPLVLLRYLIKTNVLSFY